MADRGNKQVMNPVRNLPVATASILFATFAGLAATSCGSPVNFQGNAMPPTPFQGNATPSPDPAATAAVSPHPIPIGNGLMPISDGHEPAE